MDAAVDSVSFLPALLGEKDKTAREAVVHHSIDGKFAIRQGKWKTDLLFRVWWMGKPERRCCKHSGNARNSAL
jgi:hypothetical protein